MDWLHKLCITALLMATVAIHRASGDSMVTGTVFCDQCKDGQISLFDYPLYGTKVAMVCPGNDGQMTAWGEQTTNWGGGYAMSFQGTPDLSSCSVQIIGNGGPNGCGASSGPPKSLRLMFSMFNMAMYSVDPLISQPAQPMSFCPRSNTPNPVSSQPPPAQINPVPSQPPPAQINPVPSQPPPAQINPVPSQPPPAQINPVKPPPPPLVMPLPPLPPAPTFFQASACPFQKWIMPDYRCNWKVVTPDAKVAIVFGPIAAQRYGTDMTLYKGMQGRGEAYKTLLREGTTALLNSYNSLQFPYHPFDVIENMNWALLGSTHQVLHTALKFMRANLGNGHITCKLNPCN